MISNSLPPEPWTGGAQHYVSDLAQSLGEQHEVMVLSGTPRHALKDVLVHALPGMPELPADEPKIKKAAWHLREQWLLRVHRATRSALAVFQPDVVHTHELQALSAGPYTA